MKIVQLFAAAGIIAGTACFISFTTAHQSPSFTGKFWKPVTMTVSPAIDLDLDGKPDTDLLANLEECDQDDAEMYKSNGKTIKHGGTVKCDEDEELTFESGTWTYNAATKELTVKHDDTEKPQTVIVKEASASRMVLTYTFKSTKGSSHTVTGVYKVK